MFTHVYSALVNSLYVSYQMGLSRIQFATFLARELHAFMNRTDMVRKMAFYFSPVITVTTKMELYFHHEYFLRNRLIITKTFR